MALQSKDPELRALGYREAFLRPQILPIRLGIFCLGFLIVLLGALLGRIGTDLMRLVAVILTASFLALLIILTRRRAMQWKEPSFALRKSLLRVDEESAGRVTRAYDLFRATTEKKRERGGSPELARAHVHRMMDMAPLAPVLKVGQRFRKGLLTLSLLLAAACLSLLQFRALAIIEGVDVILAQNGVGPFPISYVWSSSITAELPAYLDGSGRKRQLNSRFASVPMGSEVEVRIVPQSIDRQLVLTDGLQEEPFVSDGQGSLVARIIVNNESELRVGARFGDVILYDAHETRISPQNDRVPLVVLEGSGQSLQLSDVESLTLSFMAADDHGLSQIDLVVTSGQRTSRTELARLDGRKRSFRGAHTLTRQHEILSRAFLPIRVSIEARDENPLIGQEWGKSGVITLLPEPLGHQVAERHIALRAYRTAVVAYLAADIAAAHLSLRDATLARQLATKELRDSFDALRVALEKAGKVPQRSLAFLKAQHEAMALRGEERAAPKSVLLATDALIRSISAHEAEALARDLSSAVEEIAVQSRELRFNTEGVRLEGVFDLLEGAKAGAARLREVGALGLDLGSVAKGDLSRIGRSLDSKAYEMAELAALHLAERLKHGTPSFSSKGGGGVEAGPPKGSGTGKGEATGEAASEAPSEFDDLAKEVDSLAQDAASELSGLEEMLREAGRAAEADYQETSDLNEATEKLRRALSRLPRRSSSSGGPMAEASQARSQGEAMADALDAGDFTEGIERGIEADAALRRARQSLRERSSWLDVDDIDRAQEALTELLSKAKKAAEEIAKSKEGKMNSGLEARGARQNDLADRARKLASRGREPGAPLGKEAVDSLERAVELMRKAAREMAAGHGEKGIEYAQKAQTQLERTLPEQEGDSQATKNEGIGEGSQSTHGSVPDEERDRAREFRQRVEKGLSRPAGALAPAVRRYAEELK